MNKITILLADNSMDKLYHGLVIALGAKALGWSVKFFVTSQAVILFTKNRKGASKLSLPFFARIFVKLQMKRLNIPDVSKLIDEALNQGIEFYVDEAGLKLVNANKDDLFENVKLSGSISFLLEAKESDLVITL
ncbi:peroxiredoxin [Sulfolobus sp. A20]|uniref:DsrE/DsrF/DrsH-like family protein n=1 Tax=Sulfolobaceae TaxID=118883 RepID=UPI000845E8D5|nr:MULTISPECIES: DsrE/DsrF/DrsH-like family protein [unclassified Sulfolobus]TRM73756.1 peroxiredoxin [Sulfolobus sp. E5]TRM81225.1 peroxiredoxin [Sulfolobus sp. D5]TRM93351.1 peroxiredoxin [Sulfolobus sp. A20-N-G8]TRM96777.1 peroxiredoxin [Sulfolobus sp. F1]TRN00537.1 peroxiredoxin [Sulfolobus sp. E1]